MRLRRPLRPRRGLLPPLLQQIGEGVFHSGFRGFGLVCDGCLDRGGNFFRHFFNGGGDFLGGDLAGFLGGGFSFVEQIGEGVFHSGFHGFGCVCDGRIDRGGDIFRNFFNGGGDFLGGDLAGFLGGGFGFVEQIGEGVFHGGFHGFGRVCDGRIDRGGDIFRHFFNGGDRLFAEAGEQGIKIIILAGGTTGNGQRANECNEPA